MRIALFALLVACSSSAPPRPGLVSQAFSHDVDMLFVIGANNGDMQTVFAANFPKLVEALDALPTGRPSLHIGVINSGVDLGVAGVYGCPSPDPNDDGLLQNTPRITGCSPPTDRYIVDSGTDKNYSGTLDAAFSCIAQLGFSCGYHTPLEAMKRAIDGSRPENAGFLRDDASLVVVFLMDEDDCSAADPALFTLPDSEAGPGNLRCMLEGYQCDRPISPTAPGQYTGCVPKLGSYLQDPSWYVDFLRTARPQQRVAVASISGGSDNGNFSTVQLSVPAELRAAPGCTATVNGNPTIGLPAIRLASFVDAFGDDAREYSVCQSDYSGVQSDIGTLVGHIMKPCIAGAIDTRDIDTHTPGLQLSCSASAGNVSQVSQELPPCDMVDASTPAPGSTACVWFEIDPTCDTPTNIAVHAVDPPGGVLGVTCTAAH